jgi:hypothetical protein
VPIALPLSQTDKQGHLPHSQSADKVTSFRGFS